MWTYVIIFGLCLSLYHGVYFELCKDIVYSYKIGRDGKVHDFN